MSGSAPDLSDAVHSALSLVASHEHCFVLPLTISHPFLCSRQKELGSLTTRYDRHRTIMWIVRMLDRHAPVILGPILVQGAQDSDPVHRRFKQAPSRSRVALFHRTLPGSLGN